MARVVCVIEGTAERLTLKWSDGAAAFDPYHLADQPLQLFRDRPPPAAGASTTSPATTSPGPRPPTTPGPPASRTWPPPAWTRLEVCVSLAR